MHKFLKKIFNLIFSKTLVYSRGQAKNVIKLFGIKITFNYKPSVKEKNEMLDYVLNSQLDTKDFVPITDKPYNKTNTVKPIAFYLTQYHSFPENDNWFGRGFSEWSNTTKALPQYIGHYQPHLPIDVGFYNLETTDIMKRQIELAKMYGIYGFCFYYYWFSGEKVMDKPLKNFLKDKSLDMPFFLFWADEPWTKMWGEGADTDKECLHEQKFLDDDAKNFMKDILPYIKDERYIKLDNKPLLSIYRPHIHDNKKFKKFITDIREIAKENGFDDIYIMLPRRSCMDKSNLKQYIEQYNLDAMFEFCPADMGDNEFPVKNQPIINPLFKGTCFDVEKYIKTNSHIFEANCKLYKGCFPIWDNTARKCYKNAWIFESSPKLYKTWLKDLIKWTKEHYKEDEQFIFINAWNEWAEGAHLEPDQKYGYAYLQATKEALEEN